MAPISCRFRNPLVIIPLFASGLSAAAGDMTRFIIVPSIVMLSMIINFVQKVRAQNDRRHDAQFDEIQRYSLRR